MFTRFFSDANRSTLMVAAEAKFKVATPPNITAAILTNGPNGLRFIPSKLQYLFLFLFSHSISQTTHLHQNTIDTVSFLVTKKNNSNNNRHWDEWSCQLVYHLWMGLFPVGFSCYVLVSVLVFCLLFYLVTKKKKKVQCRHKRLAFRACLLRVVLLVWNFNIILCCLHVLLSGESTLKKNASSSMKWKS